MDIPLQVSWASTKVIDNPDNIAGNTEQNSCLFDSTFPYYLPYSKTKFKIYKQIKYKDFDNDKDE